MNLSFIKSKQCPVCGCDVIVGENVELEHRLGRVREHANGGRWEHREFACGCRISYIPNFSKEEVSRECSHDPEIIERENKRHKAKKEILDKIEQLDVDDAYKVKLKDNICYV